MIALKDERKLIEQQINMLIHNDGRLKEVFDWIVSVPGIGSTTATEIIVVTNEMTTITDPNQMACHAGVAPFEYRSGTSIRGKTRVSHQARNRLRALLHLGAMSCIRKEGELRTYYQRKVAEGKIGSPKRQNAGTQCYSKQDYSPGIRCCSTKGEV